MDMLEKSQKVWRVRIPFCSTYKNHKKGEFITEGDIAEKELNIAISRHWVLSVVDWDLWNKRKKRT